MKKLFYRSLGLLVLLQGTAMADVLLEKSTSPGFVMPSYAITTNCKLTDNGKLIVEKQLGNLKSSQTLPVKLSVATIKSTITAAALGTIEEQPFPVDAGSTLYQAYSKQAGGKMKTILLWQENGNSGQKKINNAQEATTLRNFIDLNCGDALQQ
jgi:hypothetical protein